MNKIPIKIKDSSETNRQDIKKALNLNQLFSPKVIVKKNYFWPILTLFLFLTSLALAGGLWWFESKQSLPYQKFMPEQTQAAVFLKLSQIKDFAPPILSQLDLNYPFYQWLKGRVHQFLAEVNLSPEKDIAPLLKEDVAFFILGADKERLTWIILAQTKAEQALQVQAVFDKIEQGLRKDFSLNQLVYRQIKINSVYSFSQVERPYFYAKIDNFFILSNNLTSLHGLIDRIIGR